jgi:hypothetical protein
LARNRWGWHQGAGALTAIALLDVGYWGIFAPHFQSWGAAQVFKDLAILVVLSCVRMVAGSRKPAASSGPSSP